MTAIACVFPQIGYCQGMNFIGSMLLLVSKNKEHIAFMIFLHFLGDKSLKMECMFVQGLPELAVMNFTFDKAISKFCTKLFAHFRSVEMKTEYFTFKWSMTLFSCFLPKDVLIPIFDLFLVNGWPYIYRIGVSLLNNFLQGRILQMDSMMAISQFFREDMRNQRTFNPRDIHSIIQGSHNILITKTDLVKFKDDFYVGLAKQKLEEHSVKQQRIRNSQSKQKKTTTFLGFETGLTLPHITKSGRKRRPISQHKGNEAKPEESKQETQVFQKVQD